MSDQFDFGTEDELEEEREQSGDEWAEDASNVLGNNPLGKAAGTGTKCTVCHSEFWIKKKDHTEKFCAGYCQSGVNCQWFSLDREWWDKSAPADKKREKKVGGPQKSLSSVVCLSSTVFHCGFESAIKKNRPPTFFLCLFIGGR